MHMMFQDRHLEKLRDALFLLSLILLPLAEWRIFFLPINERVFGVDLTGYRSASLFDGVFFLFSLLVIPIIVKVVKKKKIISWSFFFLLPAILLVPVLFFYLRPSMLYLTPSFPNVIDARSFLVHLTVMVVVLLYVSRKDLAEITKISLYYYILMVLSFAILSLVALMEFSFFRTHYPFAAPFTISFPFRNQNAAAIFISLCLIGLLGTALINKRFGVLWVGLPVLGLAAALTGSRSNMVLLLSALGFFVVAYWFWSCSAQDSRKVSIHYVLAFSPVVLAFTLVTWFSNWQPIQRSFSILRDLIRDPLTLVAGQKGSPRHELWSLASSRIAKGETAQDLRMLHDSPKVWESDGSNNTFEMSLISIVDGCKRESWSISGLKTGTKYFARFFKYKEEVILAVFSDPFRTELVDQVKMLVPEVQHPHLYLFAADTDRHRVNLGGWLDNFSVRTRKDHERITFDHDENLLWYEEWYEEKYGSSTGVLRSNRAKLELQAKESNIRAYVIKENAVPSESDLYILEYEVFLDNLRAISPIGPPVRFYVGFHDSDVNEQRPKWAEIANGILVSHTRKLNKHEYAQFTSWYRELLAIHVKSDQYDSQSDSSIVSSINEWIQCGEYRQAKIGDLWRPMTNADEISILRYSNVGGDIRNYNSEDPISVKADKTWSAVNHLAGRGSTHNVYLDWIYYVGFFPFVLFFLFVMSMLIALTVFVYQGRKSFFFPYYLAVLLQTVILICSLYAHPILWSKYIWFSFGVAGALMVHKLQESNQFRLNK